MKKTLLFVLFFITGHLCFTQTYGNEWINYSQSYYQIKIVNEGIYRVDYQTLVNSGLTPTPSLFSSANMQLFGREKEQPILMFDGGDNTFDNGDYFLFYANRNDGWLDSTLYEDPNGIGNPGYSLFNDTINYFFTWNSSNTNLRYATEVSASVIGSSPSASPYVLVKTEYVAKEYYNFAQEDNGMKLSLFRNGEGFSSLTSDGMQAVGSYYEGAYNLSTPNVYTGTTPLPPPVIFHAKTNSNSDAHSSMYKDTNHHMALLIGSNHLLLADTMFKGHKQIVTNKTFSTAFLNQGTTSIFFRILKDVGAVTDYETFSYASVIYPRLPNLNGSNKDKFWIKNEIFQQGIHLDLVSTSITNPIALVTGGGTPKYNILSGAGAGAWTLATMNSTNGANQQVYIADQSQIQTVAFLDKVNGDGSFTNFNSLSFESADIIIYHPSLEVPSGQYASYRSSPEGGGYNVQMVNIEELYLQFGGGIVKHNNGLRRFAHFAYNEATAKPVALTILGKGYSVSPSRTDGNVYNENLIPGFGDPGSDICHTALLEGSGYAPLIATGRISVTDSTELADYLAKLKSYESQQDSDDIYTTETKDWQKQVMHFSGGATPYEKITFYGYMRSFENIIENAYFAGNVTTYRRPTSDPLDPNSLAQIRSQLENGVSLITFFGHSSSSGFDINIDEPSNWENHGKFPVVIGNGCFSGDIYNNDVSFSEKLVNSPDEGAIAFIASSASELDNVAFAYCTELYNQMSPKNYGLPISHQIKKTIEHLQTASGIGLGELLKSTYGAVNLNGDPLLKLNWHVRPEIEIREESVFFEPANIDLSVDTITLNLVIKNLGKSVVDTFLVEIRRNFPGTSIDSTYNIIYPFLNYVDTLKIRLPLQASISIGLNNFKIDVDIPSYIPEVDEELTNNQLNEVFYLKVDGIYPVYPYEFAVIPIDTPTVRASTINPLSETKTYYFELDVTDEFNTSSPEYRKMSITAPGGVKEVKYNEWLNSLGQHFDLHCADSTVYFWRVSVDSSVIVWNESSFQYIEGKEGWGQDHFFQFKKNDFYSVNYNRNLLLREFLPDSTDLTCSVWDTPITYAEIKDVKYSLDGQRMEYGYCGGSTAIHVVVIDPYTFVPWYTIPAQDCDVLKTEGHYFGNFNGYCQCRPRAENYFLFKQDSQGQLDSLELMLQAVPDGHYILVYPAYYPEYNQWSALNPSLFQTFSGLGATQMLQGNPNRAFIFFTRKGYPGSTIETYANGPHQLLNMEVELHTAIYSGVETAPKIGPALKWETIYWKQDPVESIPTDTTILTIEAFGINGNSSLKLDIPFSRKDSILNLNNLIDASLYPYIQLSSFYLDSVNFSPSQVDRWHVLYQPVPELAIDGTNGYYFSALTGDSLSEGEELKFAVDIKNISDYPMDSLLVSYWVEDFQQVKHVISYPRQDSLLVSEKIRDTITFSTVGMPGNNSLWVEANPYVNGSLVMTDQLEQYHFNNYAQIPFFVKADDINPILDVTFNGRHILNGDIVNPESEIVITLKDENEFLVMNDFSDTTLFGIYLTAPNGVQKRIPFTDQLGNTIMQWIPAESTFKKFKIIYPALFDQDGVYTLLVQGSDRSGNLSGDIEYRISFEVIHESSITYLMNYPNPFSTSTRFVFTLTGSVIPQEFIIQIMTISGKVVREITEDELGPMYIGRNITEYAWDGTDEFGDPLANGVYLYRVLSQLNGEEVKHRESDADSYFKKEFGKMYIMR